MQHTGQALAGGLTRTVSLGAPIPIFIAHGALECHDTMAAIQSGLQTQPIRMNSDALGTLAADTALVINSTFGSGLTRSFLIKQVMFKLRIASLASADSVIIGLVNGSATIAEIALALTSLVTDPDDASSPAVAAARQMIFWETLHQFGGADNEAHNETVSRIGGGKGIPVKEATGLAIFAYNPASGALTTGATVDGLIILRGVWLND